MDVPKAQVTEKDGEISCSVEETNRIRAALGMKPLRVGPGKDPVVENIGRTLAHEKWQQNKWQNGFLGADGCIYGIPLKAENVLCINCATGAVSTIGGPFAGHNKWEGGVVAPDGAMYCMPLKAHYVMKIMPSDPQAEAEQTRARSTALACALLALGTAVAKG